MDRDVRRNRGLGAIVLTWCLASPAAWGAGMTVEAGASLSLGGGRLDLNCLDLTSAGQVLLSTGTVVDARDVGIQAGGAIDGGLGRIELSGEWNNAGSFTPGQSAVRIDDGCSEPAASLVGDTDFHSFRAATGSGRALSVAADSVQTFSGSLTLQGEAPDNRLRLRSSADGQRAYFALLAQATQQIAGVDVKDNDASFGEPIAPGEPSSFFSVDSGNNLNWFVGIIDVLFRDSFESD